VVNCAALPSELLAGELFGHERGAFTGAVERRGGLLAAADGGTIFPDEVGDLPSTAQAMLLRFLQEREVRPIGSTRTLRVDVRVLAATNRDLGEAVGRREFCADLLDRLQEIIIDVPALREKRDDISMLTDHFLALHSRRHGLSTSVMSPEAVRALYGHGWPGNVRELDPCTSPSFGISCA